MPLRMAAVESAYLKSRAAVLGLNVPSSVLQRINASTYNQMVAVENVLLIQTVAELV